ncbi:MAG TPA: DNA gyrase C-terminal beta-propeller domain-containing protein, partial [Usitatibacter sp.]|nr:DNA gyrase C-terminal beta-propeller domain-containing protein [Usitatibacter sp.]
TVNPMILIGANGRVFNVRPSEIPGGKGDGVPVSSLAETQGTAIVGMLSGAPDTAVLLGTSGGNALRTRLEGLTTRLRAGKQFVSIDEGESVLSPSVIPVDAKEVAALSAEGRLLVFALDDVKELAGGGKGVMAIKLHEGEKMLGIVPVAGALNIAAYGRGDKRTTIAVNAGSLEHYRGTRARSGRVLQAFHKRVEGFE